MLELFIKEDKVVLEKGEKYVEVEITSFGNPCYCVALPVTVDSWQTPFGCKVGWSKYVNAESPFSDIFCSHRAR